MTTPDLSDALDAAREMIALRAKARGDVLDTDILPNFLFCDHAANHAAAVAEALLAAVAEKERLKDWKDAVLNAVKSIPEFTTGGWAGDKEGWGFVFELIRWQTRHVAELKAKLESTDDCHCGKCDWCLDNKEPTL